MTGTNLFCETCSLQFGKKIVYDIHLSFVHNVKENEGEKVTGNIENVQGLELDSNSKKSKKKFVSSDLIHKEKVSHRCPICGLISVNRKILKWHIDSVHEGKKPHKC
jgi:hypothetical protein